MNEAEPYLAFVFAKKPVFVKQRIPEPAHPVDKILFALPVVVDVDLHVPNSRARHLRKSVDQMRTVFFLWIEERVTGRPSGRIMASLSDRGPLAAPERNSFRCRFLISTAYEWFVMVRNGEPHPHRAGGRRGPSRKPVPQIPWQPELSVTGKLHLTPRTGPIAT